MLDAPVINLSEAIDSFPFVTILHKSQNWAGFEVFTYRLEPAPEFFSQPVPIFWSRTTMVVHLNGLPNTLDVHDGRRWQTTVSTPGGINFSPMNTTKLMRWDQPTTNIALSVDSRLISTVAADVIQSDPTHLKIGTLGYFQDEMIKQVAFLLSGLLREGEADNRLYGESLGVTLAHHLLYFYAGAQRIVSQPQHVSKVVIKRAIDYIQANYALDLSLQALAENAGISVAHFARLFRQATGVSAIHYLIRVRCEKASQLLKTGAYRVSEVAQMVGFFDQSHFLRHFKRLYHVTPQEWMKSDE
jgi:AraC family transcriptional regulator